MYKGRSEPFAAEQFAPAGYPVMVNNKHRIVVLINSIKLGGAEKVVQTLVHSLADSYEVHL